VMTNMIPMEVGSGKVLIRQGDVRRTILRDRPGRGRGNPRRQTPSQPRTRRIRR
jgi:hypothetical protein